MKNHKGFIPALLTLGLVLVGSLVTIGVSVLTNTNKIASNPRASIKNGDEGGNCLYANANDHGHCNNLNLECKNFKCVKKAETEEENTIVSGTKGGPCIDTSIVKNQCPDDNLECKNNICVEKINNNEESGGGSGASCDPPLKGVPCPNRACCFKMKGQDPTVYASVNARMTNSMGTPCTTEDYTNAHGIVYGAESWGYCDDDGGNYAGGGSSSGGSMSENSCTKASTSNSTNTCVQKSGSQSNDAYCRSKGYNGGWSNWACVDGDPKIICCSKLAVGGSGGSGTSSTVPANCTPSDCKTYFQMESFSSDVKVSTYMTGSLYKTGNCSGSAVNSADLYNYCKTNLGTTSNTSTTSLINGCVENVDCSEKYPKNKYPTVNKNKYSFYGGGADIEFHSGPKCSNSPVVDEEGLKAYCTTGSTDGGDTEEEVLPEIAVVVACDETPFECPNGPKKPYFKSVDGKDFYIDDACTSLIGVYNQTNLNNYCTGQGGMGLSQNIAQGTKKCEVRTEKITVDGELISVENVLELNDQVSCDHVLRASTENGVMVFRECPTFSGSNCIYICLKNEKIVNCAGTSDNKVYDKKITQSKVQITVFNINPTESLTIIVSGKGGEAVIKETEVPINSYVSGIGECSSDVDLTIFHKLKNVEEYASPTINVKCGKRAILKLNN